MKEKNENQKSSPLSTPPQSTNPIQTESDNPDRDHPRQRPGHAQPRRHLQHRRGPPHHVRHRVHLPLRRRVPRGIRKGLQRGRQAQLHGLLLLLHQGHGRVPLERVPECAGAPREDADRRRLDLPAQLCRQDPALREDRQHSELDDRASRAAADEHRDGQEGADR